MKNDGLSITALIAVIFSIVATLSVIAFADGIRAVDWMDIESITWACFGFAMLGCVLGWCAFRRPIGKLSAILGSIVVAGFLFQLVNATDGPSGDEATIVNATPKVSSTKQLSVTISLPELEVEEYVSLDIGKPATTYSASALSFGDQRLKPSVSFAYVGEIKLKNAYDHDDKSAVGKVFATKVCLLNESDDSLVYSKTEFTVYRGSELTMFDDHGVTVTLEPEDKE